MGTKLIVGVHTDAEIAKHKVAKPRNFGSLNHFDLRRFMCGYFQSTQKKVGKMRTLNQNHSFTYITSIGSTIY